ncbi:MAG: M14 family metallocarboxypeptidase [Clostridia bacterium]|nr:M14 family metallocarboxypeptidase [Clostridia bacterium]
MNYITNPTRMTYENQRKMIFSLKKAYPFIGVNIIGKSMCQRNIYSLTVGKSRNPVIIAAGFHAQEWMTTLLALRFAEIILYSKSNRTPIWGIDPSGITRSIIIVPCVNPDGVEIALNGFESAGRFSEICRKIAAVSDDKWNSNARGVDINHNFDAGWNELRRMETESGILGPSPRRYGGYAPESEPETKALVYLCRLYTPRMAIALHSQGEEIFWEYGNKKPPRSEEIAKIFSSVSGYNLIENSGLASHGGFKDWFIDYFNKPAYTIEIGKGENPLPISDFDGILKNCIPMLTLAALL